MKIKPFKKSYADRRLAQLASPGFYNPPKTVSPQPRVERIVGCVLTNQDGTFGNFDLEDPNSPLRYYRSHSEIRIKLKYDDPYKEKRGDVHQFVTSEGRVVTRWEGAHVAAAAGQCQSPLGRELLSSDIDKW